LALCVTILIGCSRMPAASSLPAASQPATGSSNFKTLYVFEKWHNGEIPVGALIGLNDTLYGATNFGGRSSKECFPNRGCGCIFEMSPTGTYTVLYRFEAKNGARPYAGLIDVGSTLYGTTQEGGQHDKGTVFAVTTAGSESVVHSFDGKDGNDPRAGLTSVNGALYGTTYYGGSTETGTVFALSPGGSSYSVLYSFQGGADGAYPFAGLTESNGTLYGTTQQGGAKNAGTVFAITTSGSESVLHSFGSGKDGSKPLAGLTVLNGQLYGTTSAGGSKKLGTIYTITPSGSESVVYSFLGGAGGQFPDASLTAIGGVLYGTTMWAFGKKDGTAFVYSP
jgi:uncharacterized repeat protein (TIGR03803 family)